MANYTQDQKQEILRDHFEHASSQWETTLQGNDVSHWLDAYTKWSLNPDDFFVASLRYGLAWDMICFVSFIWYYLYYHTGKLCYNMVQYKMPPSHKSTSVTKVGQLYFDETDAQLLQHSMSNFRKIIVKRFWHFWHDFFLKQAWYVLKCS